MRKPKPENTKQPPRTRLTDGLVAKDNSGRPSKLTDEVEAAICRALASGIDFNMAARFAGVHDGSASNWRSAGKQNASPRLRAFYEAVSKAEADAAVGFVATIVKAAQKGTWQAAAWMAERKYPRVFGQKVLVEVTHELEAFCFELSKLLPKEWMDRVYELVEDRIGPAGAAAGERMLAAQTELTPTPIP